MNAASPHIAATIAHAAAAMNASMTLEETLDTIVQAAVNTVPGFDHVGISITLGDGTIETRAGTDPLVWELDALQYGLREGPCYDAIREETITVVNHAARDQRWPTYLTEAVGKGLRSQLAVGLYNDQESLGGLNLYSTESETVTNEAVLAAQMFAARAALALGRAREVSQLQAALDTRKLIGQAVGILMERYRVDDEYALRFMTQVSHQGNLTVREVAEDLVNSVHAKIRAARVDPSDLRPLDPDPAASGLSLTVRPAAGRTSR